MRFNCGPSLSDRVTLRFARMSQWHDAFTWLPRRIDGECVWLETIERKGTFYPMQHMDDIARWVWEYRTIE